jgi:hypothetical protein
VRVADDQTDNVMKPRRELIMFARGVDRYRRGAGSLRRLGLHFFHDQTGGCEQVLTLVRSIIENQGGRILCRAECLRANLESYFRPLKRIVVMDKSSRRR